jgi:hypothetical protein
MAQSVLPSNRKCGIKTVRVDQRLWDEFGRYVRRRQGQGEPLSFGGTVERAVRELMKREPA